MAAQSLQTGCESAKIAGTVGYYRTRFFVVKSDTV